MQGDDSEYFLMYNLPIESIDSKLNQEYACVNTQKINIGNEYKIVVSDKSSLFEAIGEIEFVVDRVGEMGLPGERYGFDKILIKMPSFSIWELEECLVMISAALCVITMIFAIGYCVFKKKQREGEEGEREEESSWLSSQLTHEPSLPGKKKDSDMFDGV
jgi:hypothetical protein